jgi:phage-related baseplate assembly protein
MAITPKVFEEDVQPKLQRLQQRLELALGRALAPGDIEMLIANCFVYEMQLLCIAGNQAFRQNLVSFSTGSMLEFLGALVGVTRLPAAGAQCTLQFNFVDGHNAVQLPIGLRVQSVDGQVIFTTTKAVDIPIGMASTTVTALCQTAGASGNGYDIGKISILLDPQAFVSGVANTDVTSGGIDAETDDQLRSRISLAPSSFSVAGPSGAYKFFAKSAHPSIVDVAVVTTNPGEVTLYPLCTGGTLPSDEIKDAVLAICDDTKVRPQNDTVLVDDPTVTEYAISVTLVTYTGAIDADVITAVTANLTEYTLGKINELGMDVIVAQISALSVVDGVYKPTVVSPSSDLVMDGKSIAKCTGITVTVTGSNNG